MTRLLSLCAALAVFGACASAPAAPPAPVPPATADTAGDPGAPLGRPATPAELPPPVPEPAEPPEDSVVPEPAEPVVDSVVADPDSARFEPAVTGPRKRPRADLPVLPGAIVPRERIVAFYGNPVSERMGILGELPPDEMLSRLDEVVAQWRAADPDTPVQPALHAIAVMAAGDPGPDSLYRIRLPDRHIERVLDWADRRDAIVFLDIQTGLSSVPAELPRMEEWLVRPDVHLALDPEWNMPEGARPGTRIGTMSAEEINYAIEYLADLVEEHDLPPKVLVIHRFTSAMVRNAADIRLDPRVQVVINMDGWGPPAQKIQAYRDIVAPEAEQYTGFKLFFRNDRRNGSRLLTPEEILRLDPAPVYIQYQ